MGVAKVTTTTSSPKMNVKRSVKVSMILHLIRFGANRDDDGIVHN